MPVIDLVIVGLTVAAGVWGYRHGVMTKALSPVGFVLGAVLGLWIAAPILDRVLPDPYAPMLAVPAAVLCGLLCANALERSALPRPRHGLRLRGRGTLDGVGGALLAASVGLLLLGLLAALLGRVDTVSGSVDDSAIVDGLGAVASLGPAFGAEGSDPKVLEPGPGAERAAADVTRDPQVSAAKASVVRIVVSSCGSGRTGSGWIADDGIVVTNAHVVARSDVIAVQLEGKGRPHPAEAIWYDEDGDIAILRSPGLRSQPALPIEDRAAPGSRLAMLGFPGGGPYTVKPARLGVSSRVRVDEEEGADSTRAGKQLIADARPGNSGGPVVDSSGRVVGVVFASATPVEAAIAVPPATVKQALGRARSPVDTGACEEG